MDHGRRKRGEYNLMARYTGPKHKLARREGVNLLDKTSNSLQRRLNIPPGQHGAKRKKQLSEFGQQLREKQKLKATYGILEKQLSNIVSDVQKREGDTGELLIARLETRLDNVVFRLGLAKTRYQGRQFVSHGHILVNGKKVSIPSFQVKPEDVVTLNTKMHPRIVEREQIVPYLVREGVSGKLLRMPKREDLEVPFNTQLIIEYYSR